MDASSVCERITITRMKDYFLLGSAPYLPEWWDKHGASLEGSSISCINNSMRVVGKRHDRWYVSSDYYHHHKDKWHDILAWVGKGLIGVRITSVFLQHPKWYYNPQGGTMLLNAAYDILNRATVAGESLRLNLVGCDLDYSKPKTHFYEGGTADPKRIPPDVMLGHLQKLEKDFSPMHKIVNLGPQPSFLPFEPGDPDLS